MAEFEKGFDRDGGDNLPMWIRWRQHFDLFTASLPFEMAIAASEDVRLRERDGAPERGVSPGGRPAHAAAGGHGSV